MNNIKPAIVKPLTSLSIFIILIMIIGWIVASINPYIHHYVFLSKIILFVAAITISIVYSRVQIQKIIDQLTSLNKYIDSIKTGTIAKPNLPYFQDIVTNIDDLNKKHRESMEIFHNAVRELEMFGAPKSNSTIAPYGKTLDSISRKLSDIFHTLKETEEFRGPGKSLWDDMQGISKNLNRYVKDQKRERTELLAFLDKVNSIGYSMRLPANRDLAKPMNSLLIANETMLKEITRISENNFTVKLNGDYPPGFSDFKSSFNRGIDSNNNNISQLKNDINELKLRERQRQNEIAAKNAAKIATNPRPVMKFTDIDFSGKGFGKY